MDAMFTLKMWRCRPRVAKRFLRTRSSSVDIVGSQDCALGGRGIKKELNARIKDNQPAV